MTKYLLLKHYRGAPEAVNAVPIDQWTPEEIEDHVQVMTDFAARLEGTGEYVDSQALSPEGTFVRYDGEGRPPVTDGPFAETKDLIAGWMVIDVGTYDRALALAARGTRTKRPADVGSPDDASESVRTFRQRRAASNDHKPMLIRAQFVHKIRQYRLDYDELPGRSVTKYQLRQHDMDQ